MLPNEEWMTEATQAEARQAARQFAGILATTPQYEAFEMAQRQLQQDTTALQAIREFQQKQRDLQMMQMWGAIITRRSGPTRRCSGRYSPTWPT